MSNFTIAGGTGIGNPIPASLQLFDGDQIIKIKRDCSLELGAGWVDHNDAATAFFNAVVTYIMPQWKEEERKEARLEERSRIKALIEGKINLHKAFVEQCMKNNVEPNNGIYSAMVELNHLLREISR